MHILEEPGGGWVELTCLVQCSADEFLDFFAHLVHSESVGVSIKNIIQWCRSRRCSNCLNLLTVKGGKLISRVSIATGCRNLAQYALERLPQSHRVAFTYRNRSPNHQSQHPSFAHSFTPGSKSTYSTNDNYRCSVSHCTYQNTIHSVCKNFTLLDRNSSPRGLVRVQE